MSPEKQDVGTREKLVRTATAVAIGFTSVTSPRSIKSVDSTDSTDPNRPIVVKEVPKSTLQTDNIKVTHFDGETSVITKSQPEITPFEISTETSIPDLAKTYADIVSPAESEFLSTHKILYRIVDSTHPVSKEYLSSDVEPFLIRLSDLNKFMDLGLSFPILSPETKVNVLMKDNLVALVNMAHTDNISLYIRSGYRSYWEQQYALNKVSGDTSKVKPPGQSQHQLGLAVDFSTPENQQAIGLYSGFENTKASRWLVENSWKYGFVQPYINGHDSVDPNAEFHHYLYVGQEIAKTYHELRESGWKGDIFDLQQMITSVIDGTSR